MDLSYVLFGRQREISRLYYSSVYVLAPVLSHLLLVYYSKELSHKFWIDCDQLNKFEPKGKQLVCDDLDVCLDEDRCLDRVAVAGLESSGKCILW